METLIIDEHINIFNDFSERMLNKIINFISGSENYYSLKVYPDKLIVNDKYEYNFGDVIKKENNFIKFPLEKESLSLN